MEVQGVPLENKNVFAAIGAGNISQSLLIKIAGGGVSGVLLTARGVDFDNQLQNKPQSLLQELVRLHQEEMARYQSSYNTASTYLDNQISLFSGRINTQIENLSTAEKNELFEAMDDVIEHPNDDYYLGEYNELATDLDIPDPAALIIDYEGLKNLEQNRAVLDQVNPENIKAENISEAAISGIDNMHEGNKQIAEGRNDAISNIRDRLKSASADYDTSISRSSLAQSIDEEQAEVTAQNDFKAAVNNDQSGLDVQPLEHKISLNSGLTP